MTKTTELLRAGRDMIEHVGWTKGAYARDAEEREVRLEQPEACAFCAIGALMAAASGLCTPTFDAAYIKLAHSMCAMYRDRGACISEVNDHKKTTKADILKAYDRAIELSLK